MSAEAPPATADDLKFEDAIERLEAIVRKMEEEQVPLDELIRDYENGSRLLGVCRNRIAKARARVDLISQSLSDNSIRLDEFEESEFNPAAQEGESRDGGSDPDDIQLL